MNLLVLGGSQFAGRFFVEQASERGHSVDIFNRGKSLDPAESAAARSFVGDRDPNVGAGLASLEEAVASGERWDAVVDMSGYLPRVVGASARLLRSAARRYLFISSISVYPTDGPRGRREDASFIAPPSEGVEEIGRDTYGGLKRACEQTVLETYGEANALIIRPGLMVGPRDPTDRFTYWVRRLGTVHDEPVLAPEPRDAPVQFIDARDVSAFMLRLIETEGHGDFNVTGESISLGQMIDGMHAALASGARVVWVDRDWLDAHGFQPFKDLPLTIDAASAGFLSFDCAMARSAGLQTRSLGATSRDTDAWDMERGRPGLIAGMTRERELEWLRDQESSS